VFTSKSLVVRPFAVSRRTRTMNRPLCLLFVRQAWVRHRARQAGLPRPASVYVVSSRRGVGVKPLLAGLRRMVGYSGDVWVVRSHS
jgi:hypothetical protein